MAFNFFNDTTRLTFHEQQGNQGPYQCPQGPVNFRAARGSPDMTPRIMNLDLPADSNSVLVPLLKSEAILTDILGLFYTTSRLCLVTEVLEN